MQRSIYGPRLALAVAILVVPLLRAGDPPAKAHRARVGQAAPLFELTSTDGKTYRLADYKDKIVVLEWWNQDCPFCVGAMPTMKKLSARYGQKGVVWLAIDSTHYQTPENDARARKEYQINYPILMDTDGKVGRMYGARTTPHMFVINKGTLVYSGAIDDGGRGKRATRNYVAEVLDALLAGREPAIRTTKPYGCSVKYARKAP